MYIVEDKKIASIVGNNVKKARKNYLNKPLTQAEVAEKTGIGCIAYQNIERGKNIPSVIRLLKIANFLNVSLDELLDGVKAR